MKTYLITGAAGFIGANFLKYILKKYEDINVIVVDALTYAGNLGTIKEELKDSRVKFEKVILEIAYGETYKLPINITRCSNNYGPYHFPEKLIPLMIKNILEGKKIPVYGKGDNVRDWLYVEDHCKGIDLV